MFGSFGVSLALNIAVLPNRRWAPSSASRAAGPIYPAPIRGHAAANVGYRPVADIRRKANQGSMRDSDSADSLIDEIDAGTLRAHRHATIRSLQRHLRIEDEDVCELIALHDKGAPVDVDVLCSFSVNA